MPFLIAAAAFVLIGALSFGMAGIKLKRPKRRKQKTLPDESQEGS
jgi:hypothetical protein